jgi:hypothetical protein
MAIVGAEGGNIILSLKAENRQAGLFPQAAVYDDAGAQIAGSPFNLSDGGNGRYSLTIPTPGVVGEVYEVDFTIFTDAGYTTIATGLGHPGGDIIYVIDTDTMSAVTMWTLAKSGNAPPGSFGEALVAAAGHAGLHAVLDGGVGFPNIQVNGNNNLTQARLRIFEDKAAADAATLGAADGADSELLRLFIDLADYAAGAAAPTIQVLANMRRTSA